MKRGIALLVLTLAVIAGVVWLRGSQPATSSSAANVAVEQGASAPPSSAPQEVVAAVPRSGQPLELATFSSGCFWCTESDFDKVPGVVSTTSGYTGGRVVRPTYEQVSAGGTGHIESVEVRFDPGVVTYEQLLDVYWHNVDPFNDRGQFCDFGEQYRPVIWVHSESQRIAATASRSHVQQLFDKPVVVEIENAGTFYPAEDYHQDFHVKSSVRYRYYRWACGRDQRLAEIWRSVSD
jgi:peptide-methionine (S)-S-oxide reductase